jgi:hypothetical protein
MDQVRSAVASIGRNPLKEEPVVNDIAVISAAIDPLAPVVTGYDDQRADHRHPKKGGGPKVIHQNAAAPSATNGSYMFKDRGWNFRSEVRVWARARLPCAPHQHLSLYRVRASAAALGPVGMRASEHVAVRATWAPAV